MYEYAFMTLSSVSDLSRAVHDSRIGQGISQAELAERSGTSQRFVSEFERGKQSAEVGKVLALLSALGLKFCITASRTPEESRALVQEGIESIRAELEAKPKPTKKLVDYLAEVHG